MKKVIEYNLDVNPIKSIDETDEGYLKLWLGISDSNNPLVYLSDNGVVVENIDSDELFKIDSLNTLVGKPISNGHPDIKYLKSDNVSQYQVGTILQETRNNSGVLEVAAIITNPETVQKIKDKKLVYTSAAYHADKLVIDNNTKKQTNRKYNHVALLNTDEIPRAGIKSRIIFNSYNTDDTNDIITENKEVSKMPEILNDDIKKIIEDSIKQAFANYDSQIMENIKSTILDIQNQNEKIEDSNQESVNVESKEPNTDSFSPKEMSERVKIITKYEEVIKNKTKSKNVDYNLDSQNLKRIVLSTILPEKVLTNLDSADKISGAFEVYQIFKEQNDSLNIDSDESDDINLDSDDNTSYSTTFTSKNASNNARENFIKSICK